MRPSDKLKREREQKWSSRFERLALRLRGPASSYSAPSSAAPSPLKLSLRTLLGLHQRDSQQQQQQQQLLQQQAILLQPQPYPPLEIAAALETLGSLAPYLACDTFVYSNRAYLRKGIACLLGCGLYLIEQIDQVVPQQRPLFYQCLSQIVKRRELQFVAAEILNGSPSDAELSSEFMEPYRRLVILCQAYATQTLEQAATAQDKRSRTLSKPFLHFCATVSGLSFALLPPFRERILQSVTTDPKLLSLQEQFPQILELLDQLEATEQRWAADPSSVEGTESMAFLEEESLFYRTPPAAEPSTPPTPTATSSSSSSSSSSSTSCSADGPETGLSDEQLIAATFPTTPSLQDSSITDFELSAESSSTSSSPSASSPLEPDPILDLPEQGEDAESLLSRSAPGLLQSSFPSDFDTLTSSSTSTSTSSTSSSSTSTTTSSSSTLTSTSSPIPIPSSSSASTAFRAASDPTDPLAPSSSSLDSTTVVHSALPPRRSISAGDLNDQPQNKRNRRLSSNDVPAIVRPQVSLEESIELSHRGDSWAMAFREPNFFELFVREMLSIFVSLPRSQRPGFFWQRIPGYQPLVRRALLFMREFAPNLSNNMLELSFFLLSSNMLLLGPMCHFILSTTNATCLASVHNVLDTICRWLSHLRKEVRFLPSCIDFSDLYRAIKILLDCPRVDIALITLETLYKIIPSFGPREREVLIGKLLLEHFFFDYFLHWSFRVQAAYCYVLCFPVAVIEATTEQVPQNATSSSSSQTLSLVKRRTRSKSGLRGYSIDHRHVTMRDAMLEQLRARMPASGSKTMPKCDPNDPLKDSLVYLPRGFQLYADCQSVYKKWEHEQARSSSAGGPLVFPAMLSYSMLADDH